MELTDGQNWFLSAAVGLLVVANGVLWFLQWEDLFGRVLGVALALAGLLATVNAVRALRGVAGVEPMEWTTRKTLLNVVAVLVLSIGLLVGLARYV